MNQILSIIMPVYNAEKTVTASIDPLLTIKNFPIELVIIDDGSTDSTAEILERYARVNSFIKVIHQKNAGPGAARNAGLRNVSGAYVGFMDADDLYIPEVLEKVWKILSTNQADAVCTGIKMIRQSDFSNATTETPGSVLYQGDNSIITGKEAFKRMLDADGLDSNTYAKFYRRNKLPDDLKFYEGMLGDDIPVTWRMLMASDSVYMTKEIGYLYCIDESGSSLSGVSFAPYYFDMVDRAKELYELVIKKYPEFSEQAAGFYLDLVLQCVERILAQKDKSPYKDGLIQLIKELEIHQKEFKRTTHINKRRKQQFSLFLLNTKMKKNVREK